MVCCGWHAATIFCIFIISNLRNVETLEIRLKRQFLSKLRWSESNIERNYNFLEFGKNRAVSEIRTHGIWIGTYFVNTLSRAKSDFEASGLTKDVKMLQSAEKIKNLK